MIQLIFATLILAAGSPAAAPTTAIQALAPTELLEPTNDLAIYEAG